MSDMAPGKGFDASPEAISAARNLVRAAGQGALATLDRTTGHPHASLVAMATDPDGSPLLLMSRLAVHTQNLLADQRASLLLAAPATTADPLASGRITLSGRVAPSTSSTARRRFLARHPTSLTYADFADFAFYAMVVERAHYIAGFGRIAHLSPEQVLDDLTDATELVSAEASLVEELNHDLAADLPHLAERFGAKSTDVCLLIGIDPSGFDIRLGERTRRIDFPSRMREPAPTKAAIQRLIR